MILRRLPLGLLLASILPVALSSVACTQSTEGEGDSADVTSAVSVKGESPMFPGFAYDTGLLPKASPAQVQLKASVAGALRVSADGHRAGDKIEGNKASGKLAIDLHTKLEGNLKVTSTFKNYDGDIPGLKDIDIAATAEVPFDPYLLGDGEEIEAVANVPETKLPDVPLSGVPGHLELTVKEGTTVTAKLHGSCLQGAEKIATYTGATTTSGTIVLEAKLVLDLPAPLNKDVTLPAISIDLPEASGSIEAKSEASASVTDFTAGACAASGAAGGDGTAADPGAAGGESPNPNGPDACTELENDAPKVEAEYAVGALPEGLGGTIEDGTYVLTAVRVYVDEDSGIAPGPAGDTIKRTIRIAKGRYESVTDIMGELSTGAASMTIDGATVTRTFSCPADEPTSVAEFTATPTTVTLIFAAGSFVYTYSKQ